jgi:predicted RNA-binding protein with EMAP domain
MMKNGYIDPEELAADEKLNELENQTEDSIEYEFIDYNYYAEIIQYWMWDNLYDREKYL